MASILANTPAAQAAAAIHGRASVDVVAFPITSHVVTVSVPSGDVDEASVLADFGAQAMGRGYVQVNRTTGACLLRLR